MYDKEKQKSANRRYLNSPRGKAWLAEYHQTEKFKVIQRRYQSSAKAKANRKSKPEIYAKKRKPKFVDFKQLIENFITKKPTPDTEQVVPFDESWITDETYKDV